MKNVILFLFVVMAFASCAVLYGPNTEKLSQELELGMWKQDAIEVMGRDYFIESSSQTNEGKLDIFHFRSSYYSSYLLYFVDDRLVEFHRYVPPTPMQQEIRVVKEDAK